MLAQIPEVFLDFARPARYKGAYGGRGTGKSHSFAKLLLAKAWEKPLQLLCCREIQNSIADSVKQLLDEQIVLLGMQDFYKSIDTEIIGNNGSRFFFRGLRANPTSIQSIEGLDGAWIEEAQSVSKRSLRILTPTLRKPGSELWATWNPYDPADPIDELFRGKVPPPNSIVKQVNYWDNPWFNKTELKAEMEWDKRRDPDDYAHIWLGGYLHRSAARVFKNWKVYEFETPYDAVYLQGADWGFANDPSVLVRCHFEKPRSIYFSHEAYKIGCQIERLPLLFDTIPNARKWNTRADSARPETIDYMQRHGYPKVMAARKGAGSVEDGVEFLKNYDLIIHPRCKHLIKELTLYSWKTDKQTEEILPILEDKHNHVIDAARYAVENVRRVSYTLENVG